MSWPFQTTLLDSLCVHVSQSHLTTVLRLFLLFAALTTEEVRKWDNSRRRRRRRTHSITVYTKTSLCMDVMYERSCLNTHAEVRFSIISFANFLQSVERVSMGPRVMQRVAPRYVGPTPNDAWPIWFQNPTSLTVLDRFGMGTVNSDRAFVIVHNQVCPRPFLIPPYHLLLHTIPGKYGQRFPTWARRYQSRIKRLIVGMFEVCRKSEK